MYFLSWHLRLQLGIFRLFVWNKLTLRNICYYFRLFSQLLFYICHCVSLNCCLEFVHRSSLYTRKVWTYQRSNQKRESQNDKQDNNQRLEDINGVIRIRKSKKDRQHNGPKEKGQKDKQRSTKHYTENWKLSSNRG